MPATLLFVALAALTAADSSTSAASSEPEPATDPPSSPPPPAEQPTLRPAVALRAARPWSFTATVGPVALGTALAFKIDDAFSAPLLALTLVTTLAVHAAGNLMK